MNLIPSIVSNFFRRTGAKPERRSVYAGNYGSGLLVDFGSNESGAVVTAETALTHGTVFACVKVISESMASLPIALYRSLPGGGSELASNRPEHRLMAKAPSDRYTSYIFRQTMYVHVGLRGCAYARIFRDGRGGARELVVLHPDCVYPFFSGGKLYYQVTRHDYWGYEFDTEILLPSDVIHIVGLSTDGVRGRSPITTLRETVGMGLTGRSFAAKNLKSGTLRGILKHPGKLDSGQVGNLRTNFKDAMGAGEMPVLENGVDFQSVTLTPADADYIRIAQLNQQDITGAYRVPPHMVGIMDKATFTNIEHQSLEFVKYCLLPNIKNLEEELDRKLIPVTEQDRLFYRCNVDGLLRGDIVSRMNAYTKAVQWGIMNRDEVRDLENRNPIPDGLGQIFITPLNMVPIDQQDTVDKNTTQNG